MFGLNRWSPFEDLFTFQREVDRLFTQFWSDLPARTATAAATSFRVHADDNGWRINVPMPGVDPNHVHIETAGHTLSIRAAESEDGTKADSFHFEQTLTLPEFLDTEQVHASHRHGMLQLTIPFRESVKPRRVPIEGAAGSEQKQINAAA